jgi:hypothetical protein
MKFLALMLVVGGASPGRSVGTAEAERILVTAQSFDDVAVGYAAITPPTVHAYRALLRAPDGPDRFGKVLERGTPAGQLYALCGLFFLDPNAFDRHLARLQESPASVDRTDGCVVT